MSLLLSIAPWLLLLLALPFLLLRRPSLSSYPAQGGGATPLVSIVIPTRDDSLLLGPTLAALLDTGYPAYEVLVVDDGSQDGTREIVEALESRAPARVRLVDAGAAPDGEARAGVRAWRARACRRGYEAARGELLVFTEAGTHHGSDLLGRAVVALERERAELVSVYPRLTMNRFWERLAMPHIWLVLTARFPAAGTVNRRQRPADAAASRYFMLFRRDAYEAVGGHGTAGVGAGDAVALARALLAAGRRVFLVHGAAQLEMRMYRTLGGIEEELAVTVPAALRGPLLGWMALLLPWLTVALPLLLFAVPPATLIAALMGWATGAALRWAIWATVASLLFWLVVYRWHRIRPAYAVAYPVGALASAIILGRALLGAAGEEERGAAG